MVYSDFKQKLSISELTTNKINYKAIKAALENGSYYTFPNTFLHLLTPILEQKLQGQVRETYVDLLKRFPYIRRIFRFQEMQDPDEEDFEEEVHYVAHFLLDSIEDDKPEFATTDEFERLIPKVEFLMRNCVIGMGENLTVLHIFNDLLTNWH